MLLYTLEICPLDALAQHVHPAIAQLAIVVDVCLIPPQLCAKRWGSPTCCLQPNDKSPPS